MNRAEYRQFTGIAKGSAGGLKYHFMLAKDLDYLAEDEHDRLKLELEEISRVLNGLIKALSSTKH